MKMKRMAAAMLAAMMTVSLAACGQSGDNTKEASKKQTKETTKTTETPRGCLRRRLGGNAERACIRNRAQLFV